MAQTKPIPMISKKSQQLEGIIDVPSDKSMSHRAFMLSALAVGESYISNALTAEDVTATRHAMSCFGARITKIDPLTWAVQGVGMLEEPKIALDFGNAGTGSRLTMGMMASTPISATFVGDASLHKRPMQRILDPLHRLGASSLSRHGHRLPLTLRGTDQGLALQHKPSVASAQVKSAILLAALNIKGRTEIIETAPTRDHTEKMLLGAGVDVQTDRKNPQHPVVSIVGPQAPKPQKWVIPADPSSAAFPLVAALCVPGSEVTIKQVMLNPHRTGLFTCLEEMGADLTYANHQVVGGEEVADITARYSKLQAIDISESRAPSMIDEYPILAMAAAQAEGVTIMRGLHELRVKESDRLQIVHDHLKDAGVTCKIVGDDLHVTGGKIQGGIKIDTHLDHRIAMSFFVLGLFAENDILIDDMRTAETSFPGFAQIMSQLGASCEAC